MNTLFGLQARHSCFVSLRGTSSVTVQTRSRYFLGLRGSTLAAKAALSSTGRVSQFKSRSHSPLSFSHSMGLQPTRDRTTSLLQSHNFRPRYRSALPRDSERSSQSIWILIPRRTLLSTCSRAKKAIIGSFLLLKTQIA